MRLAAGIAISAAAALVGAAGSAGAAGGAAGPAGGAAYQPIQGAWSFEGGTVLVQPVSRHRFIGVVIRKTTFGTCTHPRGQRMWRVSGFARSYTGTHLYFKKSLPCAIDRPGEATWTVRGTRRRQTLRFCSAEPGTGPPTPSNPTTLCHTLPRVAVPASLARVCLPAAAGASVCIEGPAPLARIGCLPRGRRPAVFTASLTGTGATAAKLRVGPFRLGKRRLAQRGHTIGAGRRVSFSVRAAQFPPGPHQLRVVAWPGGHPRTLKATVWVCD